MGWNAPPPPGEGITWDDHKGRLLLVYPTEWVTAHPTVHGESDACRADIVVLDAPDGPLEVADTLVFPKILRQQMKKAIGDVLLGRLTQGVKKPGQNAPWILGEFEAGDERVADEWVRKNPRTSFQKADSPF